jgi:CheY-like chemotaxis protein
MTKILLVEDDKSLREIYGVRLLAEGYDIVSAGDGEEALAMAIKERPQLIVSDVMMPKISGFDMLDILRSTTETKAIKVIMMTALSSEDQRARGEALGADRYLVKSQVGIEDVVRTVHDVLGDALTGAAPSAFGSASTPSATPRPAPITTAPPRPSVTTAPVMPTPSAAPASPPAPQIQQRPTMPTPVAAPTPQTSTLPQPTAPFSTNRPANLGERVIHPIAPTPAASAAPDLGSLIDQELGKLNDPQPQPTPAAPVIPVPEPQPLAPAPVPVPPAPEEPQLIIPPLPPAPTPPQAAPAPQPPILQNSAINFEETPRPPVPPAQNAS